MTDNETKAAEYRKLIAAVVGLAVTLLASSGVVVDAPAIDFLVAALTAFAVWKLPNAPQVPPAQGDPLGRRGRLP